MTQTLDLPPFTLDAPSRPPRRSWTPMLLTQLVVILAVLVAGVTGAVLRGHDNSKDVLSVVQAASTTAAAQKTMRATYVFRISGAGIDVTSTGSMVTDNARQRGSGSVTAPGIGAVEFRAVDGMGYMQLPAGRADAQGHHWLSYRTLKPDAVAAGGQDPLAMLKLIGDPQKVESLGDEKVNGVDASRYRVHIDPARLANAIAKSGTNITVPPGILDQLKDAVAEIWIDADNLPRRMVMSLQIQRVKTSFTFDFFDYGKPVDVTAPDSHDVTEVASPVEAGKLLAGFRTG